MTDPAELATPILLKTEEDMPWPEDLPAFYTLSRNGLYLCRNHEFFRSCVPARTWPRELAPQDRVLEMRYPKIGRAEFERIIGFFSHVADVHGSEAAVLLVWNRTTRSMEIHVPEQRATVSESQSGWRHAHEVEYDMPLDLPADAFVIGDVHSHVDGSAYASTTDVKDETHRPGIHLVVGRIRREPPELHCEVVVDGTRFPVDPYEMLEGYEARDPDFPPEWMDRLEVEVYRAYTAYDADRDGVGRDDGHGGDGRVSGRSW